MSFIFSLQKLLDLRAQELEKEQIQLELMGQKIWQIKDRLVQERDLYFQDRTDFNNKIRLCEFSEAKTFEDSLALRQKKMMLLLQSLRTLQSEYDVQDILVKSLQKNKKSLENLKAKRKKEYQDKVSRKEAQMMDDLAISRHYFSQEG